MKIAEDVRERIDDVLFDSRLTAEQREQASADAATIRSGAITPEAWLQKWDPDAPKPVDDYEPQPEEQAVAVRDPGWDRAKTHIGNSFAYARRSVEEAWRGGRELLGVRERTPHGQWYSHLKEEGIHRDLAWRYMRIAEHLQITELQRFGSVRSAMEHVQGLLSIDQESRAPEPTGPTAADYEDATPAGEPADDAPQPTMFDDEAEPQPSPEPETPAAPAAPVVVTPIDDDPEPTPAPAPPTERAEVRPAEPRPPTQLQEAKQENEALRETLSIKEGEILALQERVAEMERNERILLSEKKGEAGIMQCYQEVSNIRAEMVSLRTSLEACKRGREDQRRRAEAYKKQLRKHGIDVRDPETWK